MGSFREIWILKRQGRNFIIEKEHLKVLIAVYVDDKIKNGNYDIFYLNNYKRRKKIIENLKGLKVCIRIFPAKLKKYEKIKKKFWNYFLDEGCVKIEEKNNSLNIRQL